MVLEGVLADTLVCVAPRIYHKCISAGKNNKPILYVKLQKVLYGCLKSALLFYKVIRKDLEKHGFQVNPYNPCIANKDINRLQFTIVLHMDDLKLSHMDEGEKDQEAIDVAGKEIWEDGNVQRE
eukprot:935464-Ditylum_brightwellii.AAC.1